MNQKKWKIRRVDVERALILCASAMVVALALHQGNVNRSSMPPLPVTQTVETELSDIINEEISAYLSGIRTAEDCARIIQSRVSIWLAEHA